MPTNYNGYVVPVDADVADAPKAFTDFTDSIPFSDFVEVVEVSAATRTVEDADNGKMLFVKTNSTLTFSTLTDGFSAAVVADTGVTVTFAGVDAEGATTSEYEVATVVTVNGTNVLTLPGEAGDCPDCPECPEPELPGLGGWSTITAVSGTYTKTEYTDAEGDWCVYEWSDDGTVTTSEGLIDVLVIGGGAAASASFSGGAGGVLHGIQQFSAAEQSIIIGTTPTSGSQTPGSRSAIGNDSIGGGLARMECPNGFSDFESSGYGAGAGSTGNAPDRDTGGPGFVSSITGTELEYAQGGGLYRTDEEYNALPPGCGSDRQNNSDVYQYRGTEGAAIIRVPQQYADSVSESYNTWLSYATVEDGVVTQVSKVADNGAYTAATDQIPCDPGVNVGYLYEDGEFVAPETEDE